MPCPNWSGILWLRRMITAHKILDRQREEPFTPFRIHLSDGRNITIGHPEQILVFRNSVAIALPTPDGEIPERGEKVSILHITSLEGVAV